MPLGDGAVNLRRDTCGLMRFGVAASFLTVLPILEGG